MKQLLYKSYISAIKNSVGSKIFRNNFFDLNGKEEDILKNGSKSCAYFVSSILKIFGLIKNIHVTVDGTVKDILGYGWKEDKLKQIKIGSILVWGKVKGNKHIGFYVGKNKAISNSSNKKYIILHSRDYNKKRKIEKVYTNSKLHV